MLSYEEALEYLYRFVDYGAVRGVRYSAETFDLGRMRNLMAELGDPHYGYPVLHIAGTKGKGSVAALAANALRCGGYRTGLYTSPHLIDFRERMQVDGQSIPRETAAALVAELQRHEPHHPGLTTFELTTALAFLYFRQANVDVAVVEVGLGGRLDATNVVEPRTSVITALSLDHTGLLGTTLPEIAAEKAGIIKPSVPVVTAPQPAEALAVIERVAAERGAPLSVVGRDWLYRPVAASPDSQVFEVWTAHEQRQINDLRAAGHPVQWRAPRYTTTLLGAHQVENGAVAIAALTALSGQGLPLAADALREGLRTVNWPGRFEILSRKPFLVVDGAHNPASAQKLAEALAAYFPGRRLWLVFGSSADKDVAGMLGVLLHPERGVKRILLTQAVHPRAVAPDTLVELARAANPDVPVETAAPVAQAVELALQLAAPEDVVVACGSLFVVAEARAAALDRARQVEGRTH